MPPALITGSKIIAAGLPVKFASASSMLVVRHCTSHDGKDLPTGQR